MEVGDLFLVWPWTDLACVDGERGRGVLGVVGWGVGSENGKLWLLERLLW